MPTVKQQLREEILKRRGLTQGRYGRLRPVKPHTRSKNKTWAMEALELEFGKPIEELLAPGVSIILVARRLGIDKGTVSKWRLRFGLR